MQIEGVVEAVDEIGLRAEVGGEVECAELNFSEALFAHGAQETFDARLAEEIDGLLGIANEKESLRTTVPGARELLDEIVLCGGSVLHLVDEKMLEARA